MARTVYLVDISHVMDRIEKPIHVTEDVWMQAWMDWFTAGGLFHYGGLCVKPREVSLRPDWTLNDYKTLWECRIHISREMSVNTGNRFFYQRFIIARELGRECTFEIDTDSCTGFLIFEE